MRAAHPFRLVLTLFLALWPAAAMGWPCPESFKNLGRTSSAKSPLLRSPDGRSVAWSLAVLQKDPEMSRGQLAIQDTQSGHIEIAFQTEKRVAGAYDAFCAIDWSADGRFLLVQQIIGPMNSDASFDALWIYDRERDGRMSVDLSHLRRTALAYWRKRGVKLEHEDWHLDAKGWEGAGSKRIVLHMYGRESFFGAWSVSMTGREPRLLAGAKDGFSIKRFGEIIDEVPDSSKELMK